MNNKIIEFKSYGEESEFDSDSINQDDSASFIKALAEIDNDKGRF